MNVLIIDIKFLVLNSENLNGGLVWWLLSRKIIPLSPLKKESEIIGLMNAI
jgi:hypothetical protein